MEMTLWILGGIIDRQARRVNRSGHLLSSSAVTPRLKRPQSAQFALASRLPAK